MSPLFDKKVSHLPSGLLRDAFCWTPFSILNTITSDWQKHRNEWINILPKSTEGRDVKRFNATPTNTFSARGASAKAAESISMFDPFLCELMYKWFSKPGMTVLDPFAGGSVRGLVAETLGRNYIGIDLSSDQVYTNKIQQKEYHSKYAGDIKGKAEWICGDSEDLYSLIRHHDSEFVRPTVYDNIERIGEFADMVFTCPPYYNLEVYTKNPNDLSRMPTYECFLDKYATILTRSAKCLKDNTFYCICVSELRANPSNLDESYYLGLVPDTINILRDAGLQYYNEIILENNIGSLPIRAPKYFNQSRKIGRHHQNILVFYKGKISSISAKFGTLQEM